MTKGRALLLGAALALTLAAPLAARSGPGYGVYLRLADGAAGSYATMVAAVPALAERAGMTVLASHEAATGGCRFHATVFVLTSPAWTARVVAAGLRSSFAAPVRLAVFEDESGTHLALANPQSLARTMVREDFDGPATEVVAALEAAVRAGFPGTPVHVAYGQVREQGLIGKTMGIVAGGPFATKVEEADHVKGTAAIGVAQVTEAVVRASARPTPRWGLVVAYQLPLPGGEGVLIGFTGEAMERKSFEIVAEGGDAGRADYVCAGIDHAPAYPLEVLVVREGGVIRVLLTDVMFRMKMYFEDAGTMKFAANMAMPGSIEDELRGRIEEGLEDLLDGLAAH